MRRILILLLSVLVMSSVVQAQEPLAPIIALSKGDFYAINPVDGSIKQLTHHPAIAGEGSPNSQRDLAISPDGQYLAYRQTPRFFQVAMKNNLIGNLGDMPSDIVLLNLSTGAEKVIANQQPNVSYNDTPRLWYRAYLTWSPDSSQVAYTQTRGIEGQTNYQAQLMIYDPLVGQAFTFVDGKQPLGKIAWLLEGIAAGTTVWDIGGHVIAHNYLNEGMTLGHYLPYDYGEYAIVDSADVIPHDGRMYVMDLLTGEYSVVEGYQSSISAVTPENSLVFFKDDNDTRPQSVVNPQTGAVFVPIEKPPYAADFTFSPDGKQFTYTLLDTSINISDLNGNERVVPFSTDTIMWSSKQYTIASNMGDQSAPVEPTTDFDNVKRCGTLPAVGLVQEGQGKVIVGGGLNRIRNAPNAEANVIGQIAEGATFKVVYGQQGVCSNAIRWAQVEYQGVTGWTAEGADGQAFLEAVQ